MEDHFSLVVIGAGWAGLAAAKTFHQLHPERTLAVLESNATIGGVWAEDRLYPGLKTNNMLGMYEFPDFPMDSETFGVKPGEHIPGHVVHRYLNAYAEKFGIKDSVLCGYDVLSAEHQGKGGWVLTVQSDGEQKKMFADRLVVATGLTSEPFLPDFDGQDEFNVPIFHVKDFLRRADTLDSAKQVTVFGGTKSAWDTVYAYATRGIQVDWVIRSSGHGPAWMAPPYVTPLKKWLEKLVHTRMLTWFSPCIWGDADGYTRTRSFYHGTAIGRAITNTFWSVLGNDVITLNGYESHPEKAKLKPWSQAMFVASSFSILNYPSDFFELVTSGKVKVHIADITGLSQKAVHLSDGTTLETDALCCATGWKHVPPFKFLPEGIDKELGIPHAPASSKGEPTFTDELVDRADKEILSQFPRLKDQPIQNKNLTPLLENKGISTTDAINPSTPLTPYTLFRFIVPPSSRFLQTRDIAFSGILMNFSVPLVMHAQSLWITAFFDGELPASVIPPLASTSDSEEQAVALERLRYETVLYSRFGKWRYPAGHGTQFPDFVFDALPYLDLLLGDLGLNIYRKGGWLAEAVEPYGPEDYKDLVAEWAEKKSGAPQ
ncbi:FAD/NAD(P)-binding domain-containing protein [Pleurostoma richardsiae]|uniref:FAD/NAD(P)-binding domain-containing protein n=1 Tax=Pleurostoma richardsiae TaxID=41990 RepID=A0AA38RI67_9PEZI|nr:FAD/NAD(P)-binding domain-containing protein [Pleurostoma richardsiae]